MVYEGFHLRLPISKTNSTGDQSKMATAVFLILFTRIVSRICLPDVESSGTAIIGSVVTPEADFVDPSPTEIRHRIGLAL